MRSYVITLTNNDESIQGALRLVDSAKNSGNTFNIKTFEAVIPEQVDTMMNHYGIRWNWPWESGAPDIQSGIFKQAYLTANKNRRIACFLSHYKLWRDCAGSNEPLMIFEHDAYVTRSIEWERFEECGFQVIGLNDPRRATRKSDIYHQKVQEQSGFCVAAPKIDMDNIAQGLAGNSAYYIKPEGAQKLIELVDEYGAWPNDAIMCRQLMPRRLGQVREYCTTLQSMVSTTKT
jgi:GR25 family glycosyltransferase involved in LPS biosynthesis